MSILFYFLIIPSLISSRWWFIKNSRFKSIFKIVVKLKVTFWIHLLEGSKWITIRFNIVLTQWFNFGLLVCAVKKLFSISTFVRKVLFVALKLILFIIFCMITWFKLVIIEIPLHTYCFIYMCALFCFFGVCFYQKKDMIQQNKVLSRWNMTSGSNFNLVYRGSVINKELWADIFKQKFGVSVYYIISSCSWNQKFLWRYVLSSNNRGLFTVYCAICSVQCSVLNVLQLPWLTDL